MSAGMAVGEGGGVELGLVTQSIPPLALAALAMALAYVEERWGLRLPAPCLPQRQSGEAVPDLRWGEPDLNQGFPEPNRGEPEENRDYPAPSWDVPASNWGDPDLNREHPEANWGAPEPKRGYPDARRDGPESNWAHPELSRECCESPELSSGLAKERGNSPAQRFAAPAQ